MSLGSQINHFLRSPDTREQSLAGDFHFFIILTKTSTQQYIYIYLHWHTFIHNIVCNTNFWYRRHSPWHDIGNHPGQFVSHVRHFCLFIFLCGMSTHFSRVYLLRFLRLPAPLPNVLCRPSWKHSGVQGHLVLHVAVGSWSSYEQVEFFRGPCKKT